METLSLEIKSGDNLTTIENISQFSLLFRVPLEFLKEFFLDELRVDGTIKQEQLYLFENISKDRIENVLISFYEKYILCKKCNSYNTHTECTKIQEFKCLKCNQQCQENRNGELKEILLYCYDCDIDYAISIKRRNTYFTFGLLQLTDNIKLHCNDCHIDYII
jgi:translation initiation factor 2 beta subunit (eIF-2beta)/eIF-5